MKKSIFSLGLLGLCVWASSAFAIGAGTVGVSDNARKAVITQATTSGGRGNQGIANAYKANQKNTYFMITQPDVDTACREKIYKCLSDYCGDVTIIPGQNNGGRCQYATESELYNYALLCLQKDTDILLPQYAANTKAGMGGMNTAARLCPSYVQQELMSYLSMANMATQLSKSHSDLCVKRRQELEAAMSCHSVALTYGNETTSMLTTYLTDYCGAGIPGGSAEMVTRFANAGNVGANVWGWAEKIVSLDLNKKGEDWQVAVDAVLASYTNRMNLACGDDMKLNTVSHPTSNQPSALQTVAAVAMGVAFPTTGGTATANPYETWDVFMEVTTSSPMYDYATAYQVTQAALTNSAITQNPFVTSAQMDNMQTAYKRGTKVFIMRDSARCYIVPVATLSSSETSMVAQQFANCVSQ